MCGYMSIYDVGLSFYGVYRGLLNLDYCFALHLLLDLSRVIVFYLSLTVQRVFRFMVCERYPR